jgi:sensor histidine kinase YesM
MSFVDGCLALEQLRLGQRLRVERSFSPEALTCHVPVFSVQPLVENAIRHAFAPQRNGGVLALSAEVAAGVLHVVVADRGPGADATQVAVASGTGLSAIRQRLQLRHGDDATLKVDTAPGRGFTVTLSLPAVSELVLDAVG